MEYFAELGYLGLFLSSFLAATVLPLSSELVLSALVVGGLPPGSLVTVATVANVLGSISNYGIGYWASLALIKKLLKISEQEFQKAKDRFKKYGMVALCFAWVPVIGDPLTVIAGVLRIRFIWFVLLVTFGKLLRYIAIVYLVLKTQ